MTELISIIPKCETFSLFFFLMHVICVFRDVKKNVILNAWGAIRIECLGGRKENPPPFPFLEGGRESVERRNKETKS